MDAREPSAGDVLLGKYRLVSELGRGGMGTVWRAEHLMLRSPVAVKLIHPRAVDSEAMAQRFSREAQASAAIRSPHVVQILDYGVEGATPFIVMELLEGESLAERLRRVGRLAPADAARTVTHVARAIQKAHEAGVVHRDLKPDNVFLVRNADEEIAKVLDFGIAKSLVDDGVGSTTRTGAVLGTPYYMSPEQARGTRAVDHRSDLWALGVIACECLTGRRPFDGQTLGDLMVKICSDPIPVPSSLGPVPPGFDAWFSRATERDPDRRFQTAPELADSLRVVVGLGASASLPPPAFQSAPVHAPASQSLPGVMPARRGAPVALLAVLGAVVLGVVAIGVVGVTWMLHRSAEPEAAASSSEVIAAAPTVSEVVSAEASATATLATRRPAPASSEGSSDVSSQVAQARAHAAAARAQAADAREQAKKAQDEAAKARAAAAVERAKALEGVSQ